VTGQDFLLPTAEVIRDSSGQIRSTLYQDIYHSAGDAVSEKEHVFLNQNNLKDRWQKLSSEESGSFTIVETGFGAGLNFLLTADLWVNTAPESWTLHYLSIEKHPLGQKDLEKCLAGWPLNDSLSRALLAGYPEPVKGRHRIWLTKNLCLTLLYADVHDAIKDLHTGADAWFLDGFDPNKNPDMWRETLWPDIARLSRQGTTLSSYTVAGAVRRGLANAGFEMSKGPGFGKKRELLKGFKIPDFNSATESGRSGKQPNVAIVGGGLAGTTCAHLLARRGVSTTLFEQSRHLGEAASGMYQLAYYPQLSAAYDPFNSLSLQAFQYLHNYLDLPDLQHVQGKRAAGFLKLQNGRTSSDDGIMRQFQNCPEIVRPVTAAEASELAGIRLNKGGSYYSRAGWMDPGSLAMAQCSSPDLTESPRLIHETSISRMDQSDDGWTLYQRSGAIAGVFTDVVIATGIQSRIFSQLADLPLTPVRGQTAVLETNALLSCLKVVLADSIGLFPCLNSQHGLSATYAQGSEDSDINFADQDWLLNKIAALFPDQTWQANEARVGIRCVAKDRHPIVGLVPDWVELGAHYAPLARNARQQVPTFSGSQEGLYVCTAFGSHGLTHIPLCADYLVSLILNEPSPLTIESEAVISPNRFLIRDLKKQSVTR
jgi:tRNA 5-methylaminomethyl-2-thiouridine biosynthesis bifunctional protein